MNAICAKRPLAQKQILIDTSQRFKLWHHGGTVALFAISHLPDLIHETHI